MFAGFLGERRGDVLQNGFSQNTNMVITQDGGLTFPTSLANPFPPASRNRKGRPTVTKPISDRASATSTRIPRSR